MKNCLDIKKLRPVVLAAFIIMMNHTSINAQAITNYAFAASSGTFTSLSGATTPTLTSGNADDGYFNNLPIGFDFWYMGTQYSTVSVSTNGWLSFGSGITDNLINNDISAGGAPRPVIAPLWDDLSFTSASNITYNTTGSIGNRIFTVQFLNARWDYSATSNCISIQAKLYESTGRIEFVYRTSLETGTLVSPSASIGITATAGGSGNFRSLNNSGTSPTVSSLTATNSIATKPANNQMYSFTPPVPATPGSLSFTNVSSSAMTLNWSDLSTNERGFVIYRSTDGVNYSFVSQVAANTTSSIQSGLSSGTYYWRIYAVSEGALSSALSGTQATSCTAPSISQYPSGSLILHYKLDGNANDAGGTNNGTLQNAPTLSGDRFNVSNRAYTLNGTSQHITTSNQYNNPQNFTISTWFKTNTTTGGKLIGFGNSQTGSSVSHDRALYMNNVGQLYFGVYYNFSQRTIFSPSTYNDNNWHIVTVTFSSTSGMTMFVDGQQVAANASYNVAENINGYWRIGYDNTGGWPSAPSSNYFKGTIDEVLIYHRALNTSEVSILSVSANGASNNGPVCTNSTLTLNATTIPGATYSWTGPNGFTSNQQNPSFIYTTAGAGTYTVDVTVAGCSGSSTGYTNVVTGAIGPTPSAITTQTCIGGSTGTITASATGGTTPYTYSMDGGAYQTSNIFSSLAAGTYTLNVRSNEGCVSSMPITITQFSAAPDNQNAAGANSWIGHVYDGIAFNSYAGQYTRPEIFNESFGGSTVCHSLTSSAGARSIYTETFSVKYRMNSTKNGLYVVDLGSDDGSRLTVDNVLVYNNWSDHGYVLVPRALINLNGASNLVYEFYENGGANIVAFENLTLVLANTLSSNTSQNLCIGSTGSMISGDVFGTLPIGISLSGTGYQWSYSTTPGGTRIDIAGATAATFTPTTSAAPFNSAGTYYLYRKAIVNSSNNLSPNPYTATNESNAATIVVTTPPSATISYSGTPFCINGAIASVTRTGTSGGVYSSSPGLTLNASTGAITPSTSTPGSYTVSYTIAAASGCAQFVTATNVVINGTVTNNHLSFSNGNSGVICATANENGTATLTSPAGTVFIYVGFASYGTPDGSCSNFTIGTCHALTSQSVTEGYILGNTSATIPATNTLFTDPCVGTTKRLYVQASYSQPVCSGSLPGTISGSIPSGGGTSFTYLWEQSTTGPTTGFVAATGTNNQQNYTPPALGQSTWFRRTVTGNVCGTNTSNPILIPVIAAPSASITYNGSPFCSSAGIGNVTLTGTTGGLFSSTSGLSINSSTGAINTAASTQGSYVVTYTIPASGSCAQFTTTTNVTITLQPNATGTYIGNPYCSNGGTIYPTGSAVGALGTFTPVAGLSLNTSTGAINLGTSTPGTYEVVYTVPASGGCAIYTKSTPLIINPAPYATISYSNGPFCNSSGSKTVTLTGTTGGVFSSTTGLSINTSTGEINLGSSAAGTYTVTYSIAASGGCSAFSTTAQVTISPWSSASFSYAGSPYTTNDGIATINFSGTTGGTFTSTTGLSINSTSGAVTLASSTPGNYIVTYTIAANGGCPEYIATANITVDQYIIPVKTWDGGAGTNNWGDANNWNPNGIPTSSDDVELTGAFTITINVNATTKNLQLNHAGLILTQEATKSLAVSGSLTLIDGTFNMAGAAPTATSGVTISGGVVGFIGTGTQLIPALNYHNIYSASTGERVLQNSGTIGISGTFTPGSNLYTITGSTISYNAAGDQDIAEFNYNNLNLATSGVKKFSAGRTSIAANLSVSGSAATNTISNNSFIRYNGTTSQVIYPTTYYGLEIASSSNVSVASNLSVARLRMNTGTLNLSSNTLSISDSAAFNAGTINNGNIISTGSVSLFAGTIFGADVSAASNELLLNGSTFNGPTTLTKTGTPSVVSAGGNVFNAPAIITNSGTVNYTLANVSPDVFNNDVTFINSGSTGNIYISHQSAGNIFNGNIVVNNTATGVHFGAGGGSSTLATGKTITIGATGFTGGTLTLSGFEQTGGTAQSLSPTGLTVLSIGPATTFNGSVNFTSPRILLEGATFNGTTALTKNGTGDNISTGGNIFNGITTLTNSGSGSFDLGNTLPETFNNSLIVNNTGTNRIQIGISSTGNTFNGDVTINHTGSVTGNNTLIARNAGSTATINGNVYLNCNHTNTASGIIIANDGQVNINGNIFLSSTNGRGILFGAASGSVILGNGYSLAIANDGYTTGTLTLNRFTQTGTTAQNLVLTGTASLLLGPSSIFNGAVNFVSPQLLLNGTQFNNAAQLEKSGATDNTSSGGNIFNAASVITNSGTGFLRMANSSRDSFNGEATFRQLGSGLLQPAYRNNNTFSKSISTVGTNSAINFGSGTGTVTFNGNITQNISGPFTTGFYNFIVDNNGSVVIPLVNCNISNALSISSGELLLNGFTANRLSAGGILTVSNGAKLNLGGSNLIPSNFNTHVIGAISTIEYSGTSQTVQPLKSAQDYGNLIISGSGIQTTSDITVRNDITVSGSLNINANTIRIGRNINSTGTFNAINGTIEMNGSVAQNIPALSFTTNTIKGLTINNNTGVSVLGQLNITDVLTVSNGTVESNGHITLKSTDLATARIAPITSASPTPITGIVNVERFVKGRRKYRLMTSSVTTSENAVLSSGQENLSIWHHWQNQGINATSNKGTFITGGSSADGFDTQTPNASLFTYDDVNRKYIPFTTANGKKTKYTPLQAGVAYYMFVYGDRLNTITTSNPNNTVLTSSGTVLTGDQTYTTVSRIPLSGVTDRFTLLGNPYASPVNWATMQRSNVSGSFWGWDPNLSSTGGYVTVSSSGTTTLMAPYSGVTGLNQYIQPGQGFFVKTTGSSPSLIIREQDKTNDFNGIAFRGQRETNDLPLIAVNIFYQNGATKVLADGVLTAFDASFSSGVTDEDASKMANTAENLSIATKGQQLSIDARPMPTHNDTIFLNIARFTKPQYTMQIFMKEIPPSSVHPYLVDSYLGTMQPLMVLDTNNITININGSIPATFDVNRFKIVFQTTVALPVKFTSVSASKKNEDIEVKWSIADESDIVKYDIERSSDGTNFNKVGEVASTGNNIIQSYNWMDENPMTGNNYYRIRAIETAGTYILSKMVVVKMEANKSEFRVFPNPIRNSEVNLSITEKRGSFEAVIFDAAGKLVGRKQINHPGGSSVYQISFGRLLTSGIYELRVVTEEGAKSIKLFVE